MPKLAFFDLKDRPATADDINRRWRALELSPVAVDGVLIDCDPDSERRMADAVDHWGELGVSALNWRMADNAHRELSRSQLQATLAGMRRARAVRSAKLFKEVQSLKEQGATLRQLINWKGDDDEDFSDMRSPGVGSSSPGVRNN